MRRAGRTLWPGLVLAIALGSTAPCRADPAPVRGALVPRFGVAHVDVMENHLARVAGGPAEARAVLSPDEIGLRYERASELGASWHRWTIYHDLVDADGFQWSVPDAIVARDAEAGMWTLAVLQGEPPPGMEKGVFVGADGAPTDEPSNAQRLNDDNPWARYVGAVAERYRPGGALCRERGWGAQGGVHAWEIGNEPNNAHFWRAGVEAYVRFLQVSYLAIKFVDPEAIVLHGGIDDGGNAMEWYDDFAAALEARARVSASVARSHFFFDRMAWHWYTARDYLVVKPDRARAILQAHGIEPKPLWITELGMPTWSEYPGPCWDPASPGRATLAEQAGFLWQAVAEALTDGAEVIVVFQLYDDCGNGPASYDALGLVRNTASHQCWTPVTNQGCWHFEPSTAGAPRPAFETYRLVVESLAAARPIESVTASGWKRVSFVAPPDRRITLAWSTTASDVAASVGAHAASATLYSLAATGLVASRVVSAQAGGYSVVLPGLTNHNGPASRPLMAGLPAMIVEVGTLAPAAAPAAAPAPEALAADSGSAGLAGSGVRSGPSLPAEPGALGASDRSPPLLAVVRELAPRSPQRFELSVMAADDHALGAFVVYYAVNRVPQEGRDWIPVGAPAPWPGQPRMGVVTVPFEAAPDGTYFFSAQAGDAAGNWTAVPTYAQASTRIAAPEAPAGVSGARRRFVDRYKYPCVPF